MKFRALWVLCVLPIFTGIFFGGCKRQVANPTFPPTYTFTATYPVPPTNTITSTPVNTSTVTSTSTSTSTYTATASPTIATPSATFTASLTPTNTDTSTLTNTPTVTSTPTITNTVGGPTDTVTSTLTDTSTATVTSTATITDTPTTTNTATFSPTATTTSTVTSTSTATTVVSTACTLLMDSFESPTENGTWDANTTNHISVGYSTSNATLGSHSLQVGVTVAGGCNMTNWYNFDPARWTNVTKVVMDLTADASLCTGGTYYQLQMVGQSSSNGKYWAPITVPTSITAGSQSVTFAIDWTQGNMTPADLISNIVFVWNTDGTGTGNMYFDNVRLVGTTTACPPTTCGLMDSFESPTENGTWDANTTNHISVSYSTSNATLGSHSLQVAVTVAGGCNMANWYNFVPARWLGATQVVMDLTADASLCTGGTYYQLQMVGQSSSNNKYWAPITIPTGITAGSQSVTFAIDWTQGNMLPADLFSNIVFVWNTDGTGIGNMYFDNVRIYNGSSCHP